MGINNFWEVVREQDHSIPLAQLAKEHFKTHGRPLWIAVDEADWRFHNLTQTQVFSIRETSDQPAFQGIEKAMFYRICRWLTMNVKLLFVFDGPRRPWKRGKRGDNRVDREKLRLLKDVLRHLKVPYHEAPGEAEAECARLQQLGVVDAVFSQDSDTRMFGSTLLIRDDRVAKTPAATDRSKENTKKSGKSVRIIRGKDIERAHNLDRDGLVLFVMLCGGDYDVKGLPGCGRATAIRAVKAGLGRTLCRCRTQQDCQAWGSELGAFLKREIPPNFPSFKTLEKYLRPNISSDEQLLNLRGLSRGWSQPIDERQLLEITSSRFDIWGRFYMNWVGPILLTQSLVSAASTRSRIPGNPHVIRLVKQRVRKDDPQSRTLERKLSFSPFGLTSLKRSDFEGERLGHWDGGKGKPFDPEHRVECEIHSYLPEHALSADVLNPPTPSPKKTSQKRKRQINANGSGAGGSVKPSTMRSSPCPINATPTTVRTSQLSGARPVPTSLSAAASRARLTADDTDSDIDIFEELDFGLKPRTSFQESIRTCSQQPANSATVRPAYSGSCPAVGSRRRRFIDDNSDLQVTIVRKADAESPQKQPKKGGALSSPVSGFPTSKASKEVQTLDLTQSPPPRSTVRRSEQASAILPPAVRLFKDLRSVESAERVSPKRQRTAAWSPLRTDASRNTTPIRTSVTADLHPSSSSRFTNVGGESVPPISAELSMERVRALRLRHFEGAPGSRGATALGVEPPSQENFSSGVSPDWIRGTESRVFIDLTID